MSMLFVLYNLFSFFPICAAVNVEVSEFIHDSDE